MSSETAEDGTWQDATFTNIEVTAKNEEAISPISSRSKSNALLRASASCVECGAQINSNAKFCPKCLNQLSINDGQDGKSPIIAALLSIIPGLGHLYAGNGLRGLLVFSAFILIPTISPDHPSDILMSISSIILFGSFFDAYRIAQGESGPFSFVDKYIMGKQKHQDYLLKQHIKHQYYLLKPHVNKIKDFAYEHRDGYGEDDLNYLQTIISKDSKIDANLLKSAVDREIDNISHREKLKIEQESKDRRLISNLKSNKDYILIQNFASKYIDGYSQEDLKNLFDLLLNKGYDIRFDLLLELVNSEIHEVKYDIFKKMILSEQPIGRISILKNFLYIRGDNFNHYLGDINRFLQENGFETTNENELTNLKREIELMAFEAKLHSNESVSIEDVDNMDGIQMENFLANLYTKMGYSVDLTKKSHDQGADLIVSKFGTKTVIQAKNYQGSVGNDAVQQVVAAKAYYGCENAAVVTNSRFTDSAIELAKTNNVELIDRDKLAELIHRYF